METKNTKSLWNLSAWKLKDIILGSLIAVLFAFICFGTVHLMFFTVIPMLAPIGLGDIPIEFVFGMFFMSAVFAPYIIRKPGVALVVGTMTGLIQVLMGSAFGTVVVSALVQGLGAELAFASMGYRKYNWKTVLLAALGATITSFILAYFRGAWDNVAFWVVGLRFTIRLLSALLFSGIIVKLLADRLAKAGVLKSYPIGEKYIGNLDIEDNE